MTDLSPAPRIALHHGHVLGSVQFVADLDRSLAIYAGVLRLDAEPERPIDAELAAAFGLPEGRGRVVVLRSESFDAGTITLVEAPDLPPTPAGRTDVIELGRTVTVVSSPVLPQMAAALTAAGIPRLHDPYPAISEWGQSQEFISFDPDGAALCMLEMKPLDGAPVRLDLSAPWKHGRDDQVSPVLRMSLIVRDLDRTLAFYRDLLGLTVIEQREFSGDVAASLGMPPCRIRMAYAGAADSDWEPGLCTLGVTEVSEPAPPTSSPPRTDTVSSGQLATVIAVTDPDAVRGRLRDAGVPFLDGADAFFDPELTLITLVPAGADV